MKRAPASPATGGAGYGRSSGSEAMTVVEGTPIRSPDAKKARTTDPLVPTDPVDAHVESLLSSSSSPMPPPMNVTQDVLEREMPEPRSLEDAFADSVEAALTCSNI